MVEREQDATSSEKNTAKALKELTLLEILALVFNAILAATAIAGLIFLYRQTAATESQTALLKKQYDDAKADEAKLRAERDDALASAKSQADSLAKLVTANKSLAGAAKISASNSGRLVKTTERTITNARDSMRLDHRAWLNVAITPELLAVGAKPAASLQIINAGRTPAINIIASYTIGIAEGSGIAPMGGEITYPNGMAPTGIIAIGESRISRVDGPHQLTQNEFDALVAGRAHLYVTGIIRYEDVFRGRHMTRFCFYSDTEIVPRDWYRFSMVERNPPPGYWKADICAGESYMD